MNLFSRLSELLDLDLDALFDQREEIETVLNQIIAEMEGIVTVAKTDTATVIANDRWRRREIRQLRADRKRWQRRIRRAFALGKRDLAHDALAHKRNIEQCLNELKGQQPMASQASEEARVIMRTLEMRLAGAKRKRQLLLAWERIALTRPRVQGNQAPASAGDSANGQRFRHLEEELEEVEQALLAHIFGERNRPSLAPIRNCRPDLVVASTGRSGSWADWFV